MYIRLIEDKPEIYSIGQLRKDNPQVSFPIHPSDELLASWNVFKLIDLPAPKIDYELQCLKRSEPYFSEGVWYVEYIPENLPETEVANNIRIKRNELLSNTDWIVAKAYEQQSTVPTEYVVYRQALRDITAQPGFPWTIAWPTLP